jgi:hypothetical protein
MEMFLIVPRSISCSDATFLAGTPWRMLRDMPPLLPLSLTRPVCFSALRVLGMPSTQFWAEVGFIINRVNVSSIFAVWGLWKRSTYESENPVSANFAVELLILPIPLNPPLSQEG